jgi:hypothetical protein
MSMRSDQKALLFLGAVGVLGAGVRIVRTAAGQQAPTTQTALERQMRVADSAAAAQRKPKGKTQAPRGRGGGRGKRARSDAGDAPSVESSSTSPGKATDRTTPSGLLDRHGYIGKRLDLDIATAAQIDSLPGVSPTMARRIAQDRLRRGPFLSMNGLQRVAGVGRLFIRKIDTLVRFSGTYAFPSPNDTVIKPRKRKSTRNP